MANPRCSEAELPQLRSPSELRAAAVIAAQLVNLAPWSMRLHLRIEPRRRAREADAQAVLERWVQMLSGHGMIEWVASRSGSRHLGWSHVVLLRLPGRGLRVDRDRVGRLWLAALGREGFEGDFSTRAHDPLLDAEVLFANGVERLQWRLMRLPDAR